MTDKTPFLMRQQQIEENLQSFSHPWNPNSEISGTQMGRILGLTRTGVNFAKIPPGKESFVYHAHYREEEWIYILSGDGIAEVNGEVFEVHAGDFMAFPTPSVAHHLKNAGNEDLVYLMGGENVEVEIADFPHLGKRMFRRKDAVEIFDLADAKSFGSLED
ncbi:cupin domain-containing protein [Egbenema bharatensis]|uniref:cupin domain-containing protein n=1 Tax=Egbenema bharatensis TaxID=3463334 RepID=UPI003A87B5B7